MYYNIIMAIAHNHNDLFVTDGRQYVHTHMESMIVEQLKYYVLLAS
jgi:hypothetical protein